MVTRIAHTNHFNLLDFRAYFIDWIIRQTSALLIRFCLHNLAIFRVRISVPSGLFSELHSRTGLSVLVWTRSLIANHMWRQPQMYRNCKCSSILLCILLLHPIYDQLVRCNYLNNKTHPLRLAPFQEQTSPLDKSSLPTFCISKMQNTSQICLEYRSNGGAKPATYFGLYSELHRLQIPNQIIHCLEKCHCHYSNIRTMWFPQSQQLKGWKW